jgi:hypothetical protein
MRIGSAAIEGEIPLCMNRNPVLLSFGGVGGLWATKLHETALPLQHAGDVFARNTLSSAIER